MNDRRFAEQVGAEAAAGEDLRAAPAGAEPTGSDAEADQPQDDGAGREAPPAPPEADAAAALEELNDRYLRLAAEFDNYKKRSAREWVDRVRWANSELLRELLEVADNLARALEVEEKDGAYTDGVRLIFQQIQALLSRQGVVAVPAVGERFDPDVHDALLHVHSDEFAEGLVCQEIRRGYRLHDRMLRPAQVAVSRGAGPGQSANGKLQAEGHSDG